jgi:hypothetical protein
MQNSKNKINTKSRSKHAKWSVFLLLLIIIFSMLTLSACDEKKNPGPSGTRPTTNGLLPGQLEPGERDHVAFILESSITSDYGKNAYQGLQLISAANAETRYVENVTVSAAYGIAEQLIKAGYNVIFFDSPVFDDEFEIMKTHVDIGLKALTGLHDVLPEDDVLNMGMEVIKYHHERWDGTGYPHGLKETEIPLPGRIMALVDVYEALRSERVYKKAFSHECSCKIIFNDKGSHFDPQLVDLFIDRHEDFAAVYDMKKIC